MVTLELYNSRCRAKCDKILLRELWQVLSFEVDGAEHIRRHIGEHIKWDGRKRLLDRRNGFFPAGLVPQVIRYLKAENIPYKIEDCREKPKTGSFAMTREASENIQSREYQEEARACLKRNARGIIVMSVGAGKCLAKGTNLLRHDGSTVAVEDVIVGDLLMGPDSKPRRVLSLARGRERMARIIPVKGAAWECNVSHVLSLRCTATHSRKYKKDAIVNISVSDYLRESDNFKQMMKLWRTGVEFPRRETPLDPYLLGLWLGDGAFRSSRIFNQDEEILDYLKTETDCTTKWDRTTFGTYVRGISHHLAEARVDGEKRIPFSYKINERQQRLALLAGLLDTDGYLHHGFFDIVTKYAGLRDDILFLARSLGLAAYSREMVGTIKSIGFRGLYHRIGISGHVDEIPCRIARRQADRRRQKKNVLNVGFKVELLPEADYYGFELDGDRMFLLDDFTVTHNTILAAQAIADKGLPTLFVTPDTGLREQTAKVFRWIFGESMVGMDVTGNHPIVVQNIQALARRDRKHFERFKVLVTDEFHHSASESYQALNHLLVSAYYRYGLTGTPVRPDGQEMVMFGVLSKVIYKKTASELIEDGWLIRPNINIHRWQLKKYSKLNYREAYARLCNDIPFQKYIAGLANDCANNRGKRTLVLVKNIEHGELLSSMIEGAVFLHGKHKRDHRENIKEAFNKGELKCLIATSIMGEGQDIPNINAFVNARFQASEIQTKQGIGRALRLAQGAGNYKESVALGKADCEVYDFLIKGQRNLLNHSVSRLLQYKSEPAFRIHVCRAN